MKVRILTALVLLCILVPVLIFSGTVAFPIVAALFCAVAVGEMQKCLGTWKKPYISIPACLLAVLLPLGTPVVGGVGENLSIMQANPNRTAMFLLVFAAVFVIYMFYLFAAAVFCRGSLSFSDVVASFVTTFYITLAFTAIPLLRFGNNGQYYYLLCFLGAWITDSFAYFTGFFFGRHKLIPEISPKKTIEGSIGGIVFCVASFLIFGLVVKQWTGRTPNYLVLACLGLLVSVLSQIGDLIASLIKREHGVKDYGKIFPGHGGVMDRFDSVIATAPLLLIACTLDSLLSIHLLL
ncbi:MAG: phosphatidate cytidylyltransferase [Clostridia bacterium]|nr:phosphatidate cytidylyltransferase [Clostridia bacterium]